MIAGLGERATIETNTVPFVAEQRQLLGALPKNASLIGQLTPIGLLLDQ